MNILEREFDRMMYAPSAVLKMLTDILPSTQNTSNITAQNLFSSSNISNSSNYSLTLSDNPNPSPSIASSIADPVAQTVNTIWELFFKPSDPQNLLEGPNAGNQSSFYSSAQEKIENHLKNQLPSCINLSNPIDSIYQCTKEGTFEFLRFSIKTINSCLTSEAVLNSAKSLSSFAINSTFTTFNEIFSANFFSISSENLSNSSDSFPNSKKAIAGCATLLAIAIFAKTYFSKENKTSKSFLQLLSKTAEYTASILTFSSINCSLPKDLSLEGRLITSAIGVGVFTGGSVLIYNALERLFLHSSKTIQALSNVASIASRVAAIGFLDQQTRDYPLLNKVTFFASSTIAITTLFTGWSKAKELGTEGIAVIAKTTKKKHHKKRPQDPRL